MNLIQGEIQVLTPNLEHVYVGPRVVKPLQGDGQLSLGSNCSILEVETSINAGIYQKIKGQNLHMMPEFP